MNTDLHWLPNTPSENLKTGVPDLPPSSFGIWALDSHSVGNFVWWLEPLLHLTFSPTSGVPHSLRTTFIMASTYTDADDGPHFQGLFLPPHPENKTQFIWLGTKQQLQSCLTSHPVLLVIDRQLSWKTTYRKSAGHHSGNFDSCAVNENCILTIVKLFGI